MAGRTQSRAVATQTNKRTRKRSERNRRAYGELLERAAEHRMIGTERKGSTPDLLQEVLDRAVGGMRYAASEVDKLGPDEFWVSKVDAQGNILVEPNKWYQLEVQCRQEVERLAGMMTQLGIAERMTQVEEARAALVVAAIRDAAREAGLSQKQMRALGTGLRKRLQEQTPVGVAA